MAGETVRTTASATSCFHGSRRPVPLASHRFLGPKYFFDSGLRRAASSHLFGGLRLRPNSTIPMSEERKRNPSVVAMAADAAGAKSN
ncbi:putative elongation factor G-2, chloroplastic [Cocos nucifera]|uniref:Putative elongation factor G-2, chloroplastic n=1 Tax=Cocos nucifera TaxID=13894 RepID=A0A8K0N8A2_COCNU|nr:putative elongation factor G-2, chloroplastic [Cocos nucifera]